MRNSVVDPGWSKAEKVVRGKNKKRIAVISFVPDKYPLGIHDFFVFV